MKNINGWIKSHCKTCLNLKTSPNRCVKNGWAWKIISWHVTEMNLFFVVFFTSWRKCSSPAKLRYFVFAFFIAPPSFSHSLLPFALLFCYKWRRRTHTKMWVLKLYNWKKMFTIMVLYEKQRMRAVPVCGVEILSLVASSHVLTLATENCLMYKSEATCTS